MKNIRAAVGTIGLGLLVLAGCASSATDGESVGGSADEISASDIMARANAYIAANVLYCQAPAGQYYTGPENCYPGVACPAPEGHPWDDYRTDCSGFVSYVWQIPSDPDTATFSYDMSGPQGWTSIAFDSLRAGDALVAEGHIKLFSKFEGANAAQIYEEYDCNKHGRVDTQGFSRIGGDQILFDGDDRPYHAIRRNALTASPSPKPTPPKKGAPTKLSPGPYGCGTLEAGRGLAPGKAIRSCDNRFELVMQGDGNLVEYGPTGSLWSTGTSGTDGYEAVMQGDGNFVLYGKFSDAWFNSGTNGHAGARLNLQDDGNIVVYSGSTAIWSTATRFISAPRQPTTKCGSIPGGFGLAAGRSIKSCDGRFELVMQADGNLVLYKSNTVLWNSGTNGKKGYKAEMQGDGNLVVYDGEGTALWNSHTGGHPGAGLDLQTDGNLVIYAGSHAVWSSGTN